MSSKARRSRHRIPDCALTLEPDPISDRYWREVWASTARLERQYLKAQKALAAAERRTEKARKTVDAAITRTSNRQAQRKLDGLLLVVEERRRELHQIELLMIPTDYNGRDSRRRGARHESGAITIPLGATTGEPIKCDPIPIFPVTTRRKEPTK